MGVFLRLGSQPKEHRLMGAGPFTRRPSRGAAGGGCGAEADGLPVSVGWHPAVRAVGRGRGITGLEAGRPPCRVPSIGWPDMSRPPDTNTDRGDRPWRPTVAIGDPDLAVEKLRKFLDLIAESDHDEIRKLLPVIEVIAKQLDPGKVSELKSVALPLGGVSWGSARVEAIRLVGIVDRQADIGQVP